MKNNLLFLVVSVLLLCTGTLSAQIVSGVNDNNRGTSITIRLAALPLCNEDFGNYRYNHFLPPEGYVDIQEKRTLPYFSLYEHKGKVKSLHVNTYEFYEEFGERKKTMKAYNKADFDENGKIINLDYKPDFNSGYKSYDIFKIIGDGNNLETEYDEEGRVCRRYFNANKRAHMDYEYDDRGRVVKITFDTGDYSENGSNITTVKYGYDTLQGHENYITSIESYEGTRKKEKAIISYRLNDLRLNKITINNYQNFQERTWEYEYDENGQFVKIVNTLNAHDNYENKETYYFERMWGAGSNSLRCDNRNVFNDKRGHEKESNDTYIFTFDERGNWIQLESDYGIFERKIEYFSEDTNTDVSDNPCVDCGKPLTKNAAFCEHCGTEQAVVLARQQWEKRQEEERLAEEKRKMEEASQIKDNSNIDLTDGTNMTNNEEETSNIPLILSVIGILIVTGVLLYKFKKK